MAGKTEKPDSPSVKVVSTNRRARHEYEILETFECGLALQGHEVKSIREGRVNIADGFAAFRGNEAFVENMHITPYSHGDVRSSTRCGSASSSSSGRRSTTSSARSRSGACPSSR